MPECYHSALQWLAYSGIQAEPGGVSRYFDGSTGEYQQISTQVTAYAVRAYLHLPLPGQTGLLSNALRAAQFLCYDASDPSTGLFPYETTRQGLPAEPLAYFLDCGLVIRALLDLWTTTSDPMYLERAERCGAAMMERMSRVDGAFFPVVDLSSGAPARTSPGKWSVEPGIYQLKVGMALIQLDEMTSSGTFSKTADHLLNWSLRRYELFLPENEGPEAVADRLPPYCYFLEGLLPFIAKRFECVQALQGGIARVEKEIEAARPVLEQSATVAQLLRLRLLSDYIGMVELDLSAADREAAAIPLFQMQTTDRRTNGAFSFGRRNGELTPQANALSTILCLQALQMWNDYKRGEMRTTWSDLF